MDWQSCVSSRAYRPPSPMMYVGSTASSVTLREANRMTVLRKLEQGQEAQAELAMWYWHQNSCLRKCALIKIASCANYEEAWTLEHALIDRWRPKLKHPFVQVLFKRSAWLSTSQDRLRTFFGSRNIHKAVIANSPLPPLTTT